MGSCKALCLEGLEACLPSGLWLWDAGTVLPVGWLPTPWLDYIRAVLGLWPHIHRAVSAGGWIRRKIIRGYCVQNDLTSVGPALVPHTGL